MGKGLVHYKMENQVKKEKEKHAHTFHCEQLSEQKPNCQNSLNLSLNCDFHFCNLAITHPQQTLSSKLNSTDLIHSSALAVLFSVSLCPSEKVHKHSSFYLNCPNLARNILPAEINWMHQYRKIPDSPS